MGLADYCFLENYNGRLRNQWQIYEEEGRAAVPPVRTPLENAGLA
jgi:hypothetical protein